MPRLGEHLIAARLLEPEQIERALRAQVLWGGRLGTNLIELGLLDLDQISRALGRQHGLTAALARHFDKANPELQERIPPELAAKWSAVPLLHVGPHKKIAIAVLDPLPADALTELADAFLCEPDGIVVSVAAELRVRYHLERVYGIARDARFLRHKGPKATPFPQFDNVPVPVDSDAEVATPIAVDDSAHPTGRAFVAEEPTPPPVTEPPVPPPPPEEVDDLARLIDEAITEATAIEPTAPVDTGRDRRTYVPTLGDPPLTPPMPTSLPAPATVVRGSASVGRVSIKKLVATEIQAGTPRAAPESLPDATRAIRRAGRRDKVAELAIQALERFVPTCSTSVLLVVRGDVATSWKQFSRAQASSNAVAVPLDKPGLVPAAIADNTTMRASGAVLGVIDRALMRVLGDETGDLVVVPIAIADKVMAVLVATVVPETPIDDVQTIAAAAAAAFARLIRDASR